MDVIIVIRIATQENTPLAQKEQIDIEAGQEQKRPATHAPATSKKVTDHLANQRTFLAWIRTGLATLTFGFVVERFGLLLRELGLKNNSLTSSTTIHYSAIIGVSLVLRIRRQIAQGQAGPANKQTP